MCSVGQHVGVCDGRFLPSPLVATQEEIIPSMCVCLYMSVCICRCVPVCVKEFALKRNPICATLAVCNGCAIGMG